MSDSEQKEMLAELVQFVAPSCTRMDVKVVALEHIRSGANECDLSFQQSNYTFAH